MKNLKFLTNKQTQFEISSLITNYDSAVLGDVLTLDIDENGNKILKFKSNNQRNFDTPPIQEILPEKIKTVQSDINKILFSNGVNYIPTHINDIIDKHTNFLVISDIEYEQKEKIYHLIFQDFKLKITNKAEAVVSLPDVDISKLSSHIPPKNGDVIMYDKKTNHFIPGNITLNKNIFLLQIQFNLTDLNILKQYNILSIEREDNLIKIFYNLELDPINVTPILSCVGALNNFIYIKKIEPLCTTLEVLSPTPDCQVILGFI